MLKIGILLDNIKAPRWVNEVIQWLQNNETVEVAVVFLNTSDNAHLKSVSALQTSAYRFLRLADRKLMPVPVNPFGKQVVDIKTAKLFPVKAIQTKFSDKFPDEAITEIKKLEIDILLRFGFRILRGAVLTAPKYGIVSMHHGDTDTYRGGPPAFWEVVNKAPTTAVTVQQLTEDLDGGNILNKTFLRTDRTSFYRNQTRLYWAGKELLINTLELIVKKGAAEYFSGIKKNNGKVFYSAPLYVNPGFFKSSGILCKWLFTTAYRKCWEALFIQQWQLIYFFSKSNSIQTSYFRFKALKPPANRIWADPFVLIKNNRPYLFFEEKFNREKNAHIACLQFDEKGKPEKTHRIVLKEDHHLSYPFVFEHNGCEYMIPESAAANETSLYKAVEFPAKWEKIKLLIGGLKVYDATLHFHEGYWFLFCTAKSSAQLSSDVYLHIFYTKDLLKDDFLPHPLNPVYRDVRIARPAGKIFEYNGKLIRPAQVSAPDYGSKIRLTQITKLSTTEFEEEFADEICPDWHKDVNATHTINHAGGLTVADILVDRFRWF